MISNRSQSRGALFGVLVATAATLIALGIVEVCASLLLGVFGKPPDHQDSVAQTLQWLDINLAPLVRDADLLWRNEPLARRIQPINPRPYGRDDNWTIEIDSRGFRGRENESSVTDDDATFRVLCIGDSVTFGFNVDQPDSYPAQLERILTARHPETRFEILNAGVPGWSWLQGHRFLEVRGLALRPDLVIMAHGTNDQFMSAKVTDSERFRQLSRPFRRELEGVRILLERTRTYRLVERIGRSFGGEEKYSTACRDQLLSTGTCKRVGLHEIERTVEASYELATQAGVRFATLNLDFLQTRAVTATRNVAARRGFPFRDAVAIVLGTRDALDESRTAGLGLMPPTRAVQPPLAQATSDSWTVLFRVLVPSTDLEYRVLGEGDLGGRGQFDEVLYDDGTHGDELARDGVFSVSLQFSRMVGAYRFKFYQGEIPEFQSLPPLPSQFGDRVVRPAGNVVTPVHQFGDLLFLAERTHPNARGHEIVASQVAELVEEQLAVQGKPGGH